mmetsp:Transcript_24341/g.84589  ORF Transcript_24341/g.84589 Transcript_24341/m.84589 type:complete len:240 (+) Transcript_24341:553-1272(+)
MAAEYASTEVSIGSSLSHMDSTRRTLCESCHSTTEMAKRMSGSAHSCDSSSSIRASAPRCGSSSSGSGRGSPLARLPREWMPRPPPLTLAAWMCGANSDALSCFTPSVTASVSTSARAMSRLILSRRTSTSSPVAPGSSTSESGPAAGIGVPPPPSAASRDGPDPSHSRTARFTHSFSIGAIIGASCSCMSSTGQCMHSGSARRSRISVTWRCSASRSASGDSVAANSRAGANSSSGGQ